jgi:hypothetical protein
MLANPSFELNGSGGQVFGGWNQFGVIGSTSNATHGSQAARVTGPNAATWDVSGYWQPFDTSPGERWSASVKVWHTTTNPLTDGSQAIVNIEWRDSGGGLISFESHTAANASTPIDEIVEFYVESGPAPSGTVETRILLGVLHNPADPIPDAYFDEATFYNLGPPTLDDIQWNDFPGGRSVDFSGYTWRVKGPGYYGPGPSSFCDDAECVWVDSSDSLHMTIKYIAGTWYSSEVVLEDALGYGDYIFTTAGRLDALHPNTVFGLFIWQYGQCWDPGYLWWNPYNEFDIEFSRWGDVHNDVGQFVCQPYDYPGNIERFAATFSDNEITSHAFRWLPDAVECRSWRGGPYDESPENMIHEWTYTGPHIPRPEQPRVHINLWQFNGNPPSVYQEVILDEFTFVPKDSVLADVPPVTPPTGLRKYYTLASPNPFNRRAAISYALEREADVEITVFDVSGRVVRSLLKKPVPPGDHEVIWDGRDDSGGRVPSGVYFYQFQAGDIVETRKMVLAK